MCERVCRAEGILWQGEEHDVMLGGQGGGLAQKQQVGNMGELRW